MFSNYPTYVGQPYPYDTSLPLPIIGWYDSDGTGELMMPILPEATPEYKAHLEAINNRTQSAYHRAVDNFKAEDLDRKCSEVHTANTQLAQ